MSLQITWTRFATLFLIAVLTAQNHNKNTKVMVRFGTMAWGGMTFAAWPQGLCGLAIDQGSM